MKFLLIALFATTASAALAPLHKAKERIDGSYIVKLKDGTDLTTAVNSLRESPFFSILGGRIDIVYGNGLNAFAATLEEKALDMIRRMNIVEYVEEDGIYRALAVGSWGLDRIDQRHLPLDDSYTAPRTGSGQTVYVIDTGIRHSHNEFDTNRASYHWDYQTSNGGEDCNGHGTHCAGTVGGSTYGVAPGVTLKSVRVLSCYGSGSTTNIVNGLNSINEGVGSFAIGGGASTSLDNAVASAVGRGVVMVVAAGNSNANACNYSPAREPSAITVAATDSSDNRRSSSNYGSCVDIFAPGTSITSTWHTSDSATSTLSGSSMAAAHCAGAAALLLQRGVTANSVPSTMVEEATSDVVGNPGSGSPNKLLYVK